MKTKIAAALVTLACVASIGFPAAADEDASTARTRSTATAQPIQPRPETSGRFDILLEEVLNRPKNALRIFPFLFAGTTE